MSWTEADHERARAAFAKANVSVDTTAEGETIETPMPYMLHAVAAALNAVEPPKPSLSEADQALLDNWFQYHAPTDEQKERLTQLRAAGKVFAEKVVDLCPPSADRTHAIRVIRDAVFWANASIMCGGK